MGGIYRGGEAQRQGSARPRDELHSQIVRGGREAPALGGAGRAPPVLGAPAGGVERLVKHRARLIGAHETHILRLRPVNREARRWRMPRYFRPQIPGATVFYTVALAERGTSLLTDEIDLLRWVFAKGQKERPWYVDAIVVLPDHLHGVFTLPDGDCDYATRWSILKGRFSRGLPKGVRSASKCRRRERGIWQRRFWEHHIRNDADYRAHVQYCWKNPVKQGLVERVGEWPFRPITGMFARGGCQRNGCRVCALRAPYLTR